RSWASPIGVLNVRKWVFAVSPSARTAINLPAWYVVIRTEMRNWSSRAGRVVVWTLLSGAGSDTGGPPGVRAEERVTDRSPARPLRILANREGRRCTSVRLFGLPLP